MTVKHLPGGGIEIVCDGPDHILDDPEDDSGATPDPASFVCVEGAGDDQGGYAPASFLSDQPTSAWARDDAQDVGWVAVGSFDECPACLEREDHY